MSDWYAKKHVYAIQHPSTFKTVYIGISAHPEFRLCQHYKSRHNPILRRWLLSNPEPKLKVLTPLLDHSKAVDFERHLIKRLYAKGKPLFNKSAYNL